DVPGGATAPLDAVADVGDRQLVARLEPARLHPLAVDPDAVGAPQVADENLAVDLAHAAMPPRDPDRVEPGVALRMAADDDQGAIQEDVGPSGQGLESGGHGGRSWSDRLRSANGPRLPSDTSSAGGVPDRDAGQAGIRHIGGR